MEWVIAIVIILIAFVPIVHRINQRIHKIELKLNEIITQSDIEK